MSLRTNFWRIAGALAAVAIAVLAFTPALSAQQLTGNIFGSAQDEQGGRLPGVTVTLIGAGAPRVFTTDARGEYRFLNIAPGENYTLTYELQGFTKVTKTGVQVSIGRNTETSATMKLSSVEATVTVRGESALHETRKVETGATVTQVELKSIPSARDPWVVLQSVPGIQVDRVNVGGSESGQQSVYVGKGSQTNQGVWNVDGVTITDMGALGSSPAYYDFDSFEEIQVGTGGTELSAATPGVQLNLVTKRGTNEYHGSARVFLEKARWQSENTNADLIAQGGAAASGNRISEVQDYGVEIGGPIWKDHVWVWGSYGRNQVDLITTGGATDKTTLEGVNGKGNVQFLEGTAGTLFYSRDDKLKFGRSVGPLRPPETGWNQDGPTLIWKGELSQVFSSKLFATASYSFVDGGFELVPQGGLNVNVFKDVNGVYHNSYEFYQTSRPQHQVAGNASYFFNTGSLGHELKFGFQYRKTPVTSTSIWGGDTTSLGNFQDGIAVMYRNATWNNNLEYYNGFIGDTMTAGNLTVNAGVRYDNQKGNPGQSTVSANPVIPDILPGFSVAAAPTVVHWKDWEPRVGATYAIGSRKELVLKASYARYADQLGTGNISPFSPAAGYSYLSYYWTDTNHDNTVQRNELDFSQIYGAYNLDPNNTTSTAVFNRVDPNLKAPKTDEFIVGADYELTQDLVVGAAYTYRRYTDAIFGPGNGVGVNDFTLTNTNTFKMLDYHPAQVLGPDGVLRSPSFANCARPEFAGICVPFTQAVYAFTNGAPSGKFFQNNDNYHQTYNGAELTLNKRLANKWSARANFSLIDWKQYNNGVAGCMDAGGAAADPNNQRSSGGTGAAYGASCPGTDIVAPRSTGSGNKGGVFLNAKWQFNVSGLYQLPLGFNIAGNFFGRQGYPFIQWVQSAPTPNDGLGARLVIDGKIDRVRYDNVYDLDLRLDKNIHVNPLDIVVSLEVFNVTNQDTVLQRQGRENTATFNQIIEQQAPRVLRLGARISF